MEPPRSRQSSPPASAPAPAPAPAPGAVARGVGQFALPRRRPRGGLTAALAALAPRPPFRVLVGLLVLGLAVAVLGEVQGPPKQLRLHVEAPRRLRRRLEEAQVLDLPPDADARLPAAIGGLAHAAEVVVRLVRRLLLLR